MNAGIAFISRKSRKTDVAWRYAIAVVLVVCCIGLAYVEIVVAPWFINEVVSMFPETTLLKEPSMFWEWAILLAVQATLLCTAALQHLLHADVIWSESHAFVEGLGFGVAGPDVERYVVAGGRIDGRSRARSDTRWSLHGGRGTARQRIDHRCTGF